MGLSLDSASGFANGFLQWIFPMDVASQTFLSLAATNWNEYGSSGYCVTHGNAGVEIPRSCGCWFWVGGGFYRSCPVSDQHLAVVTETSQQAGVLSTGFTPVASWSMSPRWGPASPVITHSPNNHCFTPTCLWPAWPGCFRIPAWFQLAVSACSLSL